MSYLFYIDKVSKCLLNSDAVKLCPELGVLDEQEITCLVLTYDYYSPYNQFPEEDRQRKGLLHVYAGNAPDKFFLKEKIKAAIEAYKSLQYNPKIDMIRLYYTKVDDLNKTLMKTKDDKEINDNVNSIKVLRNYIKELEEEVLGDKIEEGVVVGKSELSWLEKMLSNKANYDAVTKKKK